MSAWPGVIQRHRRVLPVTDRTPVAVALESASRPVSVPARLDAVLTQIGP